MIPILSKEFRVIAPDLIGFGKSDKLISKAAYSYQNHMDWMTTFIEELELDNMVLLTQIVNINIFITFSFHRGFVGYDCS